MSPDEYAEALWAGGMEPREVARCYQYALKNGVESLVWGGLCARFDEPSCANWDCLNPDHQVVHLELG